MNLDPKDLGLSRIRSLALFSIKSQPHLVGHCDKALGSWDHFFALLPLTGYFEAASECHPKLFLALFFFQSEVIEPVLPQAAQLGIHFFYATHSTFLRYLITPLVKESRKRLKKKKSPAPDRFRTHNLLITRCVLYRCATTTAYWFKIQIEKGSSLFDFVFFNLKESFSLRLQDGDHFFIAKDEKYYLRHVGDDPRPKDPANFGKDFPGLREDLRRLDPPFKNTCQARHNRLCPLCTTMNLQTCLKSSVVVPPLAQCLEHWLSKLEVQEGYYTFFFLPFQLHVSNNDMIAFEKNF